MSLKSGVGKTRHGLDRDGPFESQPDRAEESQAQAHREKIKNKNVQKNYKGLKRFSAQARKSPGSLTTPILSCLYFCPIP